MSEKRATLGFGFRPGERRHHMLVAIPKKADAEVTIYERYNWDEESAQQTLNVYGEDLAKAAISKQKWKLLEETLKTEFNKRLKKNKLPIGRFTGQTPVERMLGKEMLVLVWAVEHCDPSNIPVALRNWLGLAPEERWWLYTMTNAASGNIGDHSKGWRKALRYALTENPIDTTRQISLFDAMMRHDEEEGLDE